MSVMSCAKKNTREPWTHQTSWFPRIFHPHKVGVQPTKNCGISSFHPEKYEKIIENPYIPIYIILLYIYNHIENHQKMEKIIEHPMQKWSQVRHLLIWGRPTVLLLLAGVHRFGAASGLWQRKRIFKVSKASRMEADVANLLFISHELAMIVSMYPLSNEQNKCYQMLYGTPGTWWI